MDIEGSDEELQAAISASLLDEVKESKQKEDESPESVIQYFISDNLQKSNCCEYEKISIVVNRNDIFKSTIRSISRKKFSFQKPLTVTFSGEEAVDTGGPKREFFRLLMREVSALKIFKDGWFIHDLLSLSNNDFYLAGQLIAWSILQGGGGPNCLSMEIYKFVSGEKTNKLHEKIRDEGLKEILSALDKLEDEEGFKAFLDKHADHICDYGYINIYLAKLGDKCDIYYSLLNQFYKYSVLGEMQQFQNGLSFIGKFDCIWSNKKLFEMVLSNKKKDLTWQTFKSLFTSITYSDKGSNKRTGEDETIYSWELFLQDVNDQEAEFKFEEMLVFITGASSIPPLGFAEQPTINFYTIENNIRRLPWSSTCSNTLYLPRNANPEMIKEMMTQSVLEGQGFGKI